MKNNMNLFWKQKESPNLLEKDKENNVTHALLILIRDNKDFLEKLLRKIKRGIRIKSKYNVYFQVNRKLRYKTLNTKNKIIVSITSKYALPEKLRKEATKKKNLPDGLIIDDNTSILIESKVLGRKDQDQIRRYNKQFFGGNGEVVDITWEEDIFRLAQSLAKNKPKTIPDYLFKEFKNYLEVVNLNGFSGIPFFNKEENYDKEVASEVLKTLIMDIKTKRWFSKHDFKLAERPKTGASWDYFHDKEITEKSPIKFPHYSIYIFVNFFGIDCLFHNFELNRILKDPKLYKEFADFLNELGKRSPDYFLRALRYRKIANKDKSKGVRTGPDYEDFEFSFQIKHFIRKNKDWKDKLRSYLKLVSKEKLKQITILKRAFYLDKAHNNLSKAEPCFKFIKETIDETKPFYKKVLKIYGGKSR